MLPCRESRAGHAQRVGSKVPVVEPAYRTTHQQDARGRRRRKSLGDAERTMPGPSELRREMPRAGTHERKRKVSTPDLREDCEVVQQLTETRILQAGSGTLFHRVWSLRRGMRLLAPPGMTFTASRRITSQGRTADGNAIRRTMAVASATASTLLPKLSRRKLRQTDRWAGTSIGVPGGASRVR